MTKHPHNGFGDVDLTSAWSRRAKASKKKAKPEANGLDIPDFLRVENRDKKRVKPTVPVKAAVKNHVAPTRLEQIEDPEFRTYVEGEIKAGRIQGKWLADATTLKMLRSQFNGKTATKQEGLARLAEYKATHPRPPGKPKQAYPEDALHIVSFDQANPRKPGSANHAKYEKFKAYLATNRAATVAEIVANTGYYRNDLMWDVKQGRIKLGNGLPKVTKELTEGLAWKGKTSAPIKKPKAKKK